MAFPKEGLPPMFGQVPFDLGSPVHSQEFPTGQVLLHRCMQRVGDGAPGLLGLVYISGGEAVLVQEKGHLVKPSGCKTSRYINPKKTTVDVGIYHDVQIVGTI